MGEHAYMDPGSNVASVGPFERFPVVVNGYLVPGLQAKDFGQEVEVVYDNRWAIDVPTEKASAFIRFVANVIAVGKGHPCHPGPDTWQPSLGPNGDPPAYTKLLPFGG